ncbi:hypothetical protein NQ318_018150 [Aromia moschata]|uniref:Mos1 transposase HTH domain-containing protein n=1 Tax=Aromia moschata TaxID=1265417 RepID=A0AAV8ZCW8_9CUCU|nr:hypothetical protein NQ318_018150 [Aromia moschata]
MSYLTESLKIEILMMIGYGDRARTQCEVVRLFREIEAQYREMGHVRKVPSKRQAVVDDDTKLNLLLALDENPITPARQLARDTKLCNIGQVATAKVEAHSSLFLSIFDYFSQNFWLHRHTEPYTVLQTQFVNLQHQEVVYHASVALPSWCHTTRESTTKLTMSKTTD